MNKLKRLCIILLAAVFCISVAVPAGAGNSGVGISISTDKESYTLGEEIKTSVTVKNESGQDLNDVQVEVSLPDGYKSSDLTQNLGSLANGASSDTLGVTLTPLKVYIDSISDQGITVSEASTSTGWEAMEEGGLNYMHLKTTDDSTPRFDITTGVDEDVRQYVYQVDVYIAGDTVGNKIFVGRIADSSSTKQNTLLVIEKDGSLSVNNLPIEGHSIVYNQWMEIAIAVDRDTGTEAVYIDGALIAENLALHNFVDDNGNPETIRIGLYSDSSGDGVGVEAWFNRVKLYEGLALREFDDKYIVMTPEEEEEALREQMQSTIVETDAAAQGILTDDIAFSTTSSYFHAQGGKHDYSEYGAAAYYEDGKVMVDVDVLAYALGVSVNVSGGKAVFGSASVDAVEKNGDFFVDAAALGRATGWYVYDTDDRQFVVLSDSNTEYVNSQSPYNNQENSDVVWRYLHFDRPTGDELYDALIENTNTEEHDYLLMSADELKALKENVKTNPDVKAAYEELIELCDMYLIQPVEEYVIKNNLRLYQAAKNAKGKLYDLSVAWLITEDEKYAERLWAELEQVCINWKDWNVEKHYLDAGILGPGVAVAYDALYDYLSDEQKESIRENVTEKFLDWCVAGLSGTWRGYKFENSKHMASNWGAAVNYSMLSLVTVFMHDEPADSLLTAKCKYIAQHAVSTMEGIATALTTEGVNEEGMGYYEAVLQFLGTFLEILNSWYGDTYNFLDVPGMREYPLYGMYNESREGAYNIGAITGWEKAAVYMPPEAFIYASLYDDADSMAMYRDFRKLLGLTSTYQAEFLMFYDPEMAANGSGNAESLLLDKHYSTTDISVSRGSWIDADALYLGTTGAPDSQHSVDKAYKIHRDAGSFVLDLLDERWAYDLGRNGSETMKFVYLPDVHNILLIDPDGTMDTQKTYLGAPTVVFESKERGAKIVYDMSAVYPEKVTDYLRGFLVSDDRQTVTIRDELTLTGTSDLVWNFVTNAKIVIAEDGKSAILSKNGKSILIEGACSEDGWYFDQTVDMAPTGGWVENDVSPVSSNLSYTIEEQKAYAGSLKKLVLKAEGSGEVTITVKVSPIVEGQSFEPLSDAPISTWEIADGELPDKPMLNALYADGEAVAEFQSGVREYVLPLVYGDSIPQFTATAPEGCEITYEQAQSITDTAKITVKLGDQTVVYKISFVVEAKITDALVDNIVVGLPEGAQLPAATGGYVSYEPQAAHPAVHGMDQSMETWWTSDVAGEYIEVDFGEVLDLAGVAVAFNSGDRRNYVFDVLVSTDKLEYTRVYSGQSTGQTAEWEYIEVPIEARYIRLVGYGHLTGIWTALKEVQAVVIPGENPVDPETGEINVTWLWSVLSVLSIATIAVLLLEKKRLTGRWLGMFIGAVFLVTSVLPTTMHSKAADVSDTQTVTASKTITVDGKEVDIVVTVTYNNASSEEATQSGEETTETESASEEDTQGSTNTENTQESEEGNTEDTQGSTNTENTQESEEGDTEDTQGNTNTENTQESEEGDTEDTQESTNTENTQESEEVTTTTEAVTETEEETEEETTGPKVYLNTSGKTNLVDNSDISEQVKVATSGYSGNEGEYEWGWGQDPVDSDNTDCLYIKNSQSKDTVTVEVPITCPETINQYICAFSYCINKVDGSKWGNNITLGLYDGDTCIMDLTIGTTKKAAVNNSGWSSKYDKISVVNKWHSVVIAIDNTTCVLSIDDETIGTYTLTTTGVPDKILIGLDKNQKYGTNDTNSSIFFDYFKLYEGTELLSD